MEGSRGQWLVGGPQTVGLTFRACLDLESLELTGDSVVDSSLRRHVSDLVYRVDLLSDGGPAYLYLLFEHKSHPDVLVALQLLRYMSRLWERMLDQGHKPPLPPVVPLVFYNLLRNLVEAAATADSIEGFREDLETPVARFSLRAKFHPGYARIVASDSTQRAGPGGRCAATVATGIGFPSLLPQRLCRLHRETAPSRAQRRQ